MTRRERHEHIIAYQAECVRRWETDSLRNRLANGDFSALTDEALEQLAAACVRHHRRNQRMNAESRRIYAARQQQGVTQ